MSQNPLFPQVNCHIFERRNEHDVSKSFCLHFQVINVMAVSGFSFLLVTEQKFEHRAVWVVVGHRSQERELVSVNTLSSVPALFPMLPCDAVTITAAGAKWAKEEVIVLLKLGCLNNVHFYCPGTVPRNGHLV